MHHVPRPEITEADRATWGYPLNRSPKRHDGASRQLLSNTTNVAQMYPGTGTHFVNIFVGAPHQTVSVIVSTASHYTAFPCNTCSGCGTHTEAYFKTSKSSSCLYPVPCSQGCLHYCTGSECAMSQSYTEGSSWSAKEAIDDVWMAEHDEAEAGPNSKFKVRLPFGCQYKESGLFNTQVSNGIMGFAHGDSSTMVPKLFAAGLITSKSFSLCFQRQFGVIVLGGGDTRLHQRPMLYVPYTRSSNWYAVSVKAVSIGAAVRTSNVQTSAKLESIGSTTPFGTGKGTIVDSGTTDTYLPSSVAAAFKAAFSRATNLLPGGYRTGVEYHLPIGHVYSTGNSGSKRPALPDIVFTLAGAPGAPDVNVVMWPSAYLELVQHTKGSTQGTFKARVYLDEGSGAVLGANVMRNHDMHFDQENSRIGWAPSSCEAPGDDTVGTVTAAPTPPTPATAPPTPATAPPTPTLPTPTPPTPTVTAAPTPQTPVTAPPTPAPTPASCCAAHSDDCATCSASSTCGGACNWFSASATKCQAYWSGESCPAPTPPPTASPTAMPTAAPTPSPTATPTAAPTQDATQCAKLPRDQRDCVLVPTLHADDGSALCPECDGCSGTTPCIGFYGYCPNADGTDCVDVPEPDAPTPPPTPPPTPEPPTPAPATVAVNEVLLTFGLQKSAPAAGTVIYQRHDGMDCSNLMDIECNKDHDSSPAQFAVRCTANPKCESYTLRHGHPWCLKYHADLFNESFSTCFVKVTPMAAQTDVVSFWRAHATDLKASVAATINGLNGEAPVCAKENVELSVAAAPGTTARNLRALLGADNRTVVVTAKAHVEEANGVTVADAKAAVEAALATTALSAKLLEEIGQRFPEARREKALALEFVQAVTTGTALASPTPAPPTPATPGGGSVVPGGEGGSSNVALAIGLGVFSVSCAGVLLRQRKRAAALSAETFAETTPYVTMDEYHTVTPGRTTIALGERNAATGGYDVSSTTGEGRYAVL
jgi:hypothetical protein